MQNWRWLTTQLTRKIWFRAALIGLSAVILALAAPLIAPLIPYEFGEIGSRAVDDVLTILASSMLAVTTFSLAAMVTAFSGASQNGTPRATELLIEDASAQNALSTFLGAFIFAIVGIIALKTGYYGTQARAVMLLGTVIVIAIIVLVLLHWIGQLTHFGRVADTISRVERKAQRALKRFDGPLHVTGTIDHRPPEGDFRPICPDQSGYVAHVDRNKLSELAQGWASEIKLVGPPGTFASRSRPLAWVAKGADVEEPENGDEEEGGGTVCRKVRSCFTIDDARDFDQDPRFGLVVLGEIASRALSPAVNDPGTAIAVLSSGLRVFDDFLDREIPGDHKLDGLTEPGLSLEDMVRDLIVPIARDGAALVEVHLRVQEVLGAIAARTDEHRDTFASIAAEARDRSLRALDNEKDKERLCAAHQRAFGETSPEKPYHRAR